MKWHVKSQQTPQNLDELREILLANRGIKTAAEVKAFFAPKSPLEFTLAEVGLDAAEMQKAIQRIKQAKIRNEDVLIFGDYDADGVCATAILWETLKSFGVVARPFIPDRAKHGYGISERSLTAVLAEKKPDLIITVDNGIVAHAAFAQLKAAGIDAILTDHHQTDAALGLPPAVAVVHSTQLCGSTVAWFLGRELNRELGGEDAADSKDSADAPADSNAKNSLDLAAIATVTDQMPLIGVNRSFVKFGLEALQKTKRVGVQLLCAKAGIEQKDISVNTINYAIGPRINAMGRLKHGMDALRLLCTKSMERADQLVNELNETNSSRQELTSAMIEHALAQAKLWEGENLIIVDSPDYHEGVIGLIAGKLMEQFYKPAIAISVGPELAKASARSVAGVNIIELIRLVKEDLLEAGGHPMAAGFGLLPAKLPQVKARLLELAKTNIQPDLLQPSVDIETYLPFHLATLETIEFLMDFAPFGPQNREPIFGLQNAELVEVTTMGKEDKHLKIFIDATASTTSTGSEHVSAKLTGVGWNLGHLTTQLQEGVSVNLAGVLSLNEWKGRKTLQVMIKDVQTMEKEL